jgi:hypothetical protein
MTLEMKSLESEALTTLAYPKVLAKIARDALLNYHQEHICQEH